MMRKNGSFKFTDASLFASIGLQTDNKNMKKKSRFKKNSTMMSLEDVIEKDLYDLDDDEEGESYCQWDVVGSRAFYPATERKVVKKVKPGYYKILFDQERRSYFLSKRDIITDELINLPIENGLEIVEDIKKFWSMKERYDKYSLIHKRGILMYGPAGSGKTSILNQLINLLVDDHKGIVFSIEDADDLESFSSFSYSFRQIEPKRPIIVIIEDIDGLLDGGRNVEKMLLNILDGINQIENVAYIATTNYPEKLGARLINRPGRFDRRFKIGYPNAMVRKSFFEAKMHEDDFDIIDLKEMVKKTSKLTIAHCKEVFTEHVIKGRNLDELIVEMKEMNTQKLHSDDDMPKGKVGFDSDESWNDGFDNIYWKDILPQLLQQRKEREEKTKKKK